MLEKTKPNRFLDFWECVVVFPLCHLALNIILMQRYNIINVLILYVKTNCFSENLLQFFEGVQNLWEVTVGILYQSTLGGSRYTFYYGREL